MKSKISKCVACNDGKCLFNHFNFKESIKVLTTDELVNAISKEAGKTHVSQTWYIAGKRKQAYSKRVNGIEVEAVCTLFKQNMSSQEVRVEIASK